MVNMCDFPVSGSPPCETNFTIYICSIVDKRRYIIKLLCFTLPLRYLRTTMKGTYANARIRKVPGETIANAYLNILSVLVRRHDLYDKMGNVCRDRLLRNELHECAKLHWQPLFTLQRLRVVSNTQLHDNTSCVPFSFQ
jgi:hypothetical protein